jgi:hypothetical protein
MLLLGLFSCLVGCGSQELTWERAAALIEERHMPEPVTQFTYRVSLDSRYRLLQACEEAGVLSLDGDRSDLRVRLTELGKEHIRSVEKRRVEDSIDYTIHFRSSVPAQFLGITRIEPIGPNYARAGYIWKYECPPIVEACTTLSDGQRTATATFVLYDEHWRIHRGPIPEEHLPPDKRKDKTAP